MPARATAAAPDRPGAASRTLRAGRSTESIRLRPWLQLLYGKKGAEILPRVNRPEDRIWNSRSTWILLAISLLATLPVWLPAYPPMTDLPQHAAQVALLRDLHHAHFSYSALFHLNWFTPYLLGYLLIYSLTPLLGIVIACKLVVSLFAAGLPLATGLLLGSVDVDVFWAILVIPGVYGFTYQWGFLNFLIAAPLGIVFLWFVLRLPAKPAWLSLFLLAVATIGLFFCHALICGFFGLCALLCILARRDHLKTTVLNLVPLTLVLPIALLWMRRTLANPAARRPRVWDLNWQNTVEPYYVSLSDDLGLKNAGWGRITGLIPRLFGVAPSWHYLAFGAALFLLPLAAGMRLRKDPRVWPPLLICVAVLLWCPHAVFGTEFVYQRFTMFLVPLYLLVLRDSSVAIRGAVILRGVAAALVITAILLAARKAIVFSKETSGFKQVLAHMEPGQRALSLDFDHADRVSIAPTFLHFPQWYAAEKGGVVDPNAAMMHPELVLYRAGKTPEAVLWDFEWSPEEFNWGDYSGEQYRYFVVRSVEDRSAALFSTASCRVSLSYHQDEWWLYERAATCRAAPTITAPSQ